MSVMRLPANVVVSMWCSSPIHYPEPCCRLTAAAVYDKVATVFPIGRLPHGLQFVVISHSTVQVGLQADAIHMGACL